MKYLMKFMYSAILLVLFLAAFVFTETAQSQTELPTAHVFVNPSASTAKTCISHQIAISVEDVENLVAFELMVFFDPAVVEITDVENGGFLAEPGDPVFYSPDNNDGEWNTDGYISFGMAQQRDPATGAFSPKSGSGDLIHIKMNVQAINESTAFTVDDAESELVWWGQDPEEEDGPVDGELIPFTVTNGQVDTSGCAPTNIALNPSSVYENERPGTRVGAFSTTDPDGPDTFIYQMINNAGYPDNRLFEIIGDQLFTKVIFDYETRSSYNIRVRSTDSTGLWVIKTIPIEILDKGEFYYFPIFGH